MNTRHLLISASLALALILTGCGRAKNRQASPETARVLAVRVQPVAERAFERRLTIQGTLEAKRTALVASRADGNLEAIWVDEGDEVVAGKTKLFQIDPASRENALTIAKQDLAVAEASLAVAKASADKIRAEARKAELDFARYERLHAEQRVSINEFEAAEVGQAQARAGIAVAEAQVDLAERQIKQAQAALAIAQKNLDDTTAIAPLSGLISARSAEPGEFMSVGQTLLQLIDPTYIEAAAFLPAQYHPDVEPGVTHFRLGVNGRDAGSHPVTYRSPVINPTLRTFEIKGRVEHVNNLAVPGSMADLTIVFEARENLGVPSEAILVRGGNPLVFVAQEGQAVPHPVKTGLQNDGWTEILDGLKPGDLVVVEGQTQLQGGMAVEPL